MAVSNRDLDPAFKGVGQKAGLERWHIENSHPVLVPESSHDKFFTEDSYVVLKTTSMKNGGLRHDIHYWLGKNVSQNDMSIASTKAIELDASLGGRAIQYREMQGHETDKFLSYFKPCILPQEGRIASSLKHHEERGCRTRLYECKGKHVVHINEVPFARSSLSHDAIFILDTQNKVFQFNGSNISLQERAKALEVAQYIKDLYHQGKCEVASIEDGRLMADAEAGEFWGHFGGFAPLIKKTINENKKDFVIHATRLFRVEQGKVEPMETNSLTRELLDTSKCYILECGIEAFVWMGRNTSLDERKCANGVAEEFLRNLEFPNHHIIGLIEGFEIVTFRSKFDSWPQTTPVTASKDGRGRVAALLKRQGLDVKGLVKAAPTKEEPEPHIDCTGSLEVWRVNGKDKTLLSTIDQSKFYSGDCYIFQYTYIGDDKEECLVGTWFGKQSVQDERDSALALASNMIERMKFLPTQARIIEGSEPIQFFAIFQSFIVFKGGLSEGYKKSIMDNKIPDDTYTPDGLALFRIQGYGPENMQSIQVDPVASSLNSSYCYILHQGSSIFTWTGNLTSPDDHELMERQLDIIKPEMQSRTQKEGSESEQFWSLLGGKVEHGTQKIERDDECDPRLLSCSFSKGEMKVIEVFNFTQDDLMTEDVFILDCHSDIFVWVGKEMDNKTRLNALSFGEKFLEQDFLLENLSHEAPIYVFMEGSEPPFFTRFFTWDSAKSIMLGNSFQRRLTLLKNGGKPIPDKSKRRVPAFCRRSSLTSTEKPQRSRSVSSDRPRARGRSPAFNALAATFENPNARNLSTPPPMVGKLYPKSSLTLDPSKLGPKCSTIATLTSSFEKTKDPTLPRSPRLKGSSETFNKVESEEEQSFEDDEGPTYPYDRVNTTSTDPITDIDVTKREKYLSSSEFKEKFGMPKNQFYKLPKWKRDKLKKAAHLF